ncbi:MAG: molybdopterin molybdotransferase MoeA [Betaproteobacteria bacterium]|nr:molybdopterin molybdotransferase MoeA [Betaproteobacteria bacterium]
MTSILRAISCLDDYDPESLPVPQAQVILQSLVEPVTGTERLFVKNALGRVLARPVISPINVPAHDNSAMDGYAVRATDLHGDTETRLRLVGTAFAGRAFEGYVGPGECVRIMTGALLPDGGDTVVIQEVVKVEGGEVLIPAGQKPGQNTRRSGEDLRAGLPALPAGRSLRPAEIGLLASLGIAEVTVFRRVRVALFSTGDELCSIGSQPKPGEVFDSNRYTLCAMLTRLGCEVLDMGVVRDNREDLEAALLAASANADAIVTSGGVSVGEADFIRDTLSRLGEVVFWKIAMKPGRPMAFGRIGNAFLFGLPGNPVSVMVTFYQFARDALRKLSGVSPLDPVPLLDVPCETPLRKNPGRTEFQRGHLFVQDGQWKVRVTGAQGSGILRSMAEANCLIVLEHERASIAAGEVVKVQVMDGLV